MSSASLCFNLKSYVLAAKSGCESMQGTVVEYFGGWVAHRGWRHKGESSLDKTDVQNVQSATAYRPEHGVL